MSDDDAKNGGSKWIWPFGPAIAALLLFPPPNVSSTIVFKFFASVGLLVGLIIGQNITNKNGRFQSKRKERIAITVLVLFLVGISMRYFWDVKGDAENHRVEAVVDFVADNVLIGILIFLAAPAVRSISDRLWPPDRR